MAGLSGVCLYLWIKKSKTTKSYYHKVSAEGFPEIQHVIAHIYTDPQILIDPSPPPKGGGRERERERERERV